MDSIQTWTAFQGKLRNSGAAPVYSAREALAQEYVNQQRMKQPNALGSVLELSPSHAPIDSPSAIISSYSLSRSPSSNKLPFPQGKPPIEMQSSHDTTCSMTGGFKSYANEVVGGAQPASGDLAQGSLQHTHSSSRSILPKTTGRRWSMGSEPFVVPLSKGRIPSDRPDPFYCDHHDQHSLYDPSPHTPSEQSSLISILTDKWTRTTRGDNDANEKTEIENSSILRSRPPRAQRRLSEPFSSYSSISKTDFCAHPRNDAMPAIDSSKWALPKSEGHLLVDFPTTKRARGGPRNPPSKLLVDFPTSKKKQARSQDSEKGVTKAVKRSGNNF